MLLLARVERLDAAAVTDKDRLLRDQFLENLADPQVRRDIKRWVGNHPTKTFQEIRDEIQRWIDEDGTPPPPPRKAVVREVTTGHPPNEIICDEVKGAADPRKVISELVAGQKILAENLQKQQRGSNRPSPSSPWVINNGGSLDALAVGHGHISAETAQVITDRTNGVAAAGTEDLTTSSCRR